ncbi:hypothetical protein P3342_013093 [Pyrenophora teres f. teres]|uniref:Uncharacterized protein n=2 Tax=Pyrenophora teres f. teres TaxID=97479 RepID=E3RSH1_PYRTT|nr:hypothetical protein PTT_11860 [Pyrenophora teres f. teres 0-1]KAE8826690.1 hypothetical protein HRS9139_07862 [Pyrenophora teres f. teres]KAE8832207.1 hypothetical protein PTNB85_06599 [Pyrenophora teres f. teres]KAE8837184.1 hypothetical protein HRS9122_07339 [Pyrenophora teres f. teres]KAE8855869.1 hypothetical protein PTNB29_08708 [Pyrenophora teres f. teres]
MSSPEARPAYVALISCPTSQSLSPIFSTPNAYQQQFPESWPLHLHLILWAHVASDSHVGLVTKQADLLTVYEEEGQCSKTVPCTNCIRRGQQDTCRIDDIQGGPTSPSQSLSSRAQELEFLRQRLTQLENEGYQGSPTNDGTTTRDLQPETPDVHINETTDHSSSISASRDAATVLEFLAWGRRTDPDCHIVISDEPMENATPETAGVFEDLSQLPIIQLLLPSAQQVRQLVDYHRDCLSWYHGSYFDPTFQTQISDFYYKYNGLIEDPAVNLQCAALLFSILTASLTCAPDTQA